MTPSHALDLSEYTQAVNRIPAPDIKNPGFENGAEGWSMPKGFRIEPNAGINGSAALAYERVDEGERQVMASCNINLIPGVRYKISAWVRTENVVAGKNARFGAGGLLELIFSKDGKWYGELNTKEVRGTRDWVKLEGSGIVKEGADGTGSIALLLRAGMTGKIWFDDIEISPDVDSWYVYQISPNRNHTPTNESSVAFSSHYEPALKVSGLPQYSVLARLQKQDGVSEYLTDQDNNRAVFDFGQLPAGGYTVDLFLLARQEKKILAEARRSFTVVSSQRQLPPNACVIGTNGVALVAGKPFIPVGLYMGFIKKREEIDRISAAGFNCVMPYGSLDLAFEGSGKKGAAAIHEVLDYCMEKGIRIIVSLKDVYEGYGKSARLSYLEAKGEEGVVKKAVELFAGHPAMLAWYINDEAPLNLLPAQERRRALLNELDPFHPTWSVLCHFHNVRRFGNSADVLGVDPYPIRNVTTQDMLMVKNAMDECQIAGSPVWCVPQLFNWGVYLAKNVAEYEQYRDPTEVELRAMSLYMAIRGAKGFVFYQYRDLFRTKQAEATFDRRWGEVARTGRLMQEMSPYFTCDAPAPQVEVTIIAGDVVAKAYTDDRGRCVLLIAATGPGKTKAKIVCAGKSGGKSRFGFSAVSNNEIIFECDNIGSDIIDF